MNVGGARKNGLMTGIRDTLEQLRSAVVVALRAEDPRGWSDDDLPTTLGALEAVGRIVDAHRAAYAGEVADRSRVELGGDRLSSRKGCRSAAELIERVTLVSGGEARRRVALGSATRAGAGLSGEPLDPAFPEIGAALAAEELGADAAVVIIRELGRARAVADPAAFATAEHELVAAATGAGDATRGAVHRG
jgi:hypothetical protein